MMQSKFNGRAVLGRSRRCSVINKSLITSYMALAIRGR